MGYGKYGVSHLGGNSLRNGASVRSIYNRKSHSANRMVPPSGACGYRKYPKSRSKPIEFDPQYHVQRLACRAVSAAAKLPVMHVPIIGRCYSDIAV